MVLVPVSLKVAPAATENVFPVFMAIPKPPLSNVPLWTERFPVTFEAVIGVLTVTPLALELFRARSLYTTLLTPSGTVCAELPLKLNVPLPDNVPRLPPMENDPARLTVPEVPRLIVSWPALGP